MRTDMTQQLEIADFNFPEFPSIPFPRVHESIPKDAKFYFWEYPDGVPYGLFSGCDYLKEVIDLAQYLENGGEILNIEDEEDLYELNPEYSGHFSVLFMSDYEYHEWGNYCGSSVTYSVWFWFEKEDGTNVLCSIYVD